MGRVQSRCNAAGLSRETRAPSEFPLRMGTRVGTAKRPTQAAWPYPELRKRNPCLASDLTVFFARPVQRWVCSCSRLTPVLSSKRLRRNSDHEAELADGPLPKYDRALEEETHLLSLAAHWSCSFRIAWSVSPPGGGEIRRRVRRVWSAQASHPCVAEPHLKVAGFEWRTGYSLTRRIMASPE